jgi:hypothetical protein
MIIERTLLFSGSPRRKAPRDNKIKPKKRGQTPKMLASDPFRRQNIKESLRYESGTLLVMRPEADDFHNFFFFEYLIDEAVLNVDPSRKSAREVPD